MFGEVEFSKMSYNFYFGKVRRRILNLSKLIQFVLILIVSKIKI